LTQRGAGRWLAGLAALAVGLTACGSAVLPNALRSLTAHTDRMAVYLVEDGGLAVSMRSVAVTSLPVEDGLRALLDGPDAAEAAAGMQTDIPGGSHLLGVRMEGDVAVVNLSRQFAAGDNTASPSTRLAQVVFTATQFAGIQRVTFRVEGATSWLLAGTTVVSDQAIDRNAVTQAGLS
jgi:spore germination protein GerM